MQCVDEKSNTNRITMLHLLCSCRVIQYYAVQCARYAVQKQAQEGRAVIGEVQLGQKVLLASKPPSIVSMHTRLSFPEESFKSELFPQIYLDNKWDMLLIRGQGLQW